MLEIEEDEVEEAKVQRKVFVAEKTPEKCCMKKKMGEITDELKKLTVEELKEKGDKYRELI